MYWTNTTRYIDSLIKNRYDIVTNSSIKITYDLLEKSKLKHVCKIISLDLKMSTIYSIPKHISKFWNIKLTLHNKFNAN